jgi:predicted TIM-barrel fold metal-dependent hydrolase
VGVFLSADPKARAGRSLAHEDFLPFWSTVQDLDMPFAFHVVIRDEQDRMMRDWFETPPLILMELTFLGIDVMAAFTQATLSGLFERFPRLRCTVLESGATWIGAWLDRMDAKWSHSIGESPLTMKPSEYFLRQCVVSADPEETMIPDLVRRLGPDYFVWASDYPHLDASLGVLKELRENIASLSAEDQNKLLGENCLRFYNLSTEKT